MMVIGHGYVQGWLLIIFHNQLSQSDFLTE